MNRILLVVLVGSLIAVGNAHGQSETAPAELPRLGAPADAVTKPIVDPKVVQASGCCSSSPYGASSYGCSNNLCVPGRPPCNTCEHHSPVGRLFGGFLEEICCPDPCYEPRWIPEANAAFFQDSPRPITQTRIRWDRGVDYRNPDAAEFFWAQIGKKGPKFPTAAARYNEGSLYQEIGAKGASGFVEMTYRSVDSGTNPGQAGFGDMNVGAKTVLLDREILLVTMQFRTFIPIGAASNGLGTGHVSLEPSLMTALKIASKTYLQTQLAEWIPLGGTSGFQGSVFHYHFSLNHGLCRCGDLLNVVGTMELNGYTFRGRYTDFPTDPNNPVTIGLSGSSYVNAGPGLRVIFCDRADIGVGAVFDLTRGNGPGQLYRTEIRIRF